MNNNQSAPLNEEKQELWPALSHLNIKSRNSQIFIFGYCNSIQQDLWLSASGKCYWLLMLAVLTLISANCPLLHDITYFYMNTFLYIQNEFILICDSEFLISVEFTWEQLYRCAGLYVLVNRMTCTQSRIAGLICFMKMDMETTLANSLNIYLIYFI